MIVFYILPLVLLIPFVEHLTERTKEVLATYLVSKKRSAYLSHHFAPLYAVIWATIILLLISLSKLTVFNPVEVVILAGGSMVYYEISSLWKKQKREAVPTHAPDLEEYTPALDMTTGQMVNQEEIDQLADTANKGGV
ncbi:hypothetical protein CL633_01430 [bacterium]|nr:hypothetical protein [bacterium]|tara:strand:+ start:194 stop:607 length:414 start_codon:yes stop_codon:yes gene_type:complete